MKVHDDITQVIDWGMGCLLVFLDMAAFDTSDVDMLMDILYKHFGVRDDAPFLL